MKSLIYNGKEVNLCLMRQTLQIRTSLHAANLLRDHLGDLDHEELWGLYLNGQGCLIEGLMLTKGTLTFTPIDARTVIKRAILCDATAIIIGHNHPSGNPAPSASDIRETDRIKKACSLFDIALVDHIIITDCSYYSFSDDSTSNFNTSKSK